MEASEEVHAVVGRTLKKFSLVHTLLWTALTLALAISVTYIVERRMLDETSLVSLDYFHAVTAAIPNAAELQLLARGGDVARLERKLAPLLRERKVVTVKLWDTSRRLLYHSRDPGQVGKVYADNNHLARALTGEKVLSISSLSGHEHVTERALGIDRLMEFYLPIRDPETGPVVGAYEIYSSLDPFYQRVWRQRMAVWGIILTGAVFLYLGFSIHFKRASRTILDQSHEIEEKAQNLEKALADLKSVQSELIRSERLATVGQLAAGIAHEVRNPLASITGMVDIFLRDSGELIGKSEGREHLRRIGSEAARLKEIIRALLDYARPTRARIGRVDLNALVRETVPLFQMQKEYGSVDIHLDLADPPPCALADGALMQQILLNFLLNAGQAMQGKGSLAIRTHSQDPNGSVNLRVGPLPKEQEGVCVLEVRDSGPGIEPFLLPRIFDPFVTTRSSSDGVGLGLAVCLRLIEELKGAVEVESHLWEGASFRVFLISAEASTAGTRSAG